MRIAILVAATLLVACNDRETCETAARSSAQHFVRTKGNPNVKTSIDIIAPALETAIRERCREDRWSAKAIECIARNDMACWAAALTEAQRTKFEQAVGDLTAAAREPRP